MKPLVARIPKIIPLKRISASLSTCNVENHCIKKQMKMSEELFLNYYEILGCSPGSTYENLKQAYHELALRHHPDKASNLENNADEFHRIDEAWKILRDPVLRKQYDIEFKQAELEAQSGLVYARIKSEELESTENKDIMSYQCRCGSSYFVDIEALLQKNNLLHVYCEECTFMIIVET